MPLLSMVTSSTVVIMVGVPVASPLAAFMVVAPIAARPVAIVSRIVPFPFAPVALFPLPALPISTPVIVPIAIPTRVNNNGTRSFNICGRGLNVDGRGCINGAGNANVHADIDMCKGDR
jgi:hypothetical protein